MTDLNTLPKHLQNLTEKDWERLFNLQTEIHQTKKFGEMKGGDKIAENIIEMPYWSWSKITQQFFKTVYDLDIVPAFDWTNWAEGTIILENKKQDFNKFDTITLCKLLTVIIRTDRFSDGFLIQNFENGTISKIIKALESNISKH